MLIKLLLLVSRFIGNGHRIDGNKFCRRLYAYDDWRGAAVRCANFVFLWKFHWLLRLIYDKDIKWLGWQVAATFLATLEKFPQIMFGIVPAVNVSPAVVKSISENALLGGISFDFSTLHVAGSELEGFKWIKIVLFTDSMVFSPSKLSKMAVSWKALGPIRLFFFSILRIWFSINAVPSRTFVTHDGTAQKTVFVKFLSSSTVRRIIIQK